MATTQHTHPIAKGASKTGSASAAYPDLTGYALMADVTKGDNAAGQRIADEAAARSAADTALSLRIAALEALQPTPAPTPIPPPTGTVVTPADDVPALLLSGVRAFLLHGGTYRFGWGAAERSEAGVSLLPYGDGPVVIDGTGLDPHFVYLGAGASWRLGAMRLQGFLPSNSAVVAVGDGCDLRTDDGFEIAGPGAKGDNTSHGVYFHGTGTGTLTNPYIHGVPGAALQTYRGTPQVTVNRGRLGGMYISALVYSGNVTFSGTAFTEPTAGWDVRANVSRPVLTGCAGTGTAGAVRLFQD